MNILGIAGDYFTHDTSAAIVCDGEVVAAAEEERFSRSKHETRFPLAAIDFCLQQSGLRMDQVDAIAFPDKPFRTGIDSYVAEMDRELIVRLWRERHIRLRRLLHKEVLDRVLRMGARFNLGMHHGTAARLALLRKHYNAIPPLQFYDHHRSHAAATYFTSGLDEAAIVTMDWSGGPYATVTWRGEGRNIDRIRAEAETNSLGKFYSDWTQFLGLSNIPEGETVPTDFAEGKTMGLAAYGQINGSFHAPLLDLNGDGWYRYTDPPSERIHGFAPGRRDLVLEHPYPDIAAAVQDALETAVQRVVRTAVNSSGSGAVCLGGGVSLNCSSNGALRDAHIASPVWVFPAPGDAGLSVGAALLCAAEAGEPRAAQLSTAYLGPGFDRAACETALQKEPSVSYRLATNIVEETAQHLAEGHVVAWFQGRMEFGPRALCHRSILADPRTVARRDRVNRLKRREMWRPLAPVVIADRARDYFESAEASPFMLFRTYVRHSERSRLAAVVHVDGSARPQTVTSEQDPLVYELLQAFERRAGIPVLLNTSFNAAGDPIACTPDDAIRSFLKIGADVLVLGSFVVTRRRDDT